MAVRNEAPGDISNDNTPGEVKLWTSVLLRAFNDAMGEGLMAGSAVEKDRLIEEARTWLLEGGTGFQIVCENAEQDPDAVWEAARNLSQTGWHKKSTSRRKAA